MSEPTRPDGAGRAPWDRAASGEPRSDPFAVATPESVAPEPMAGDAGGSPVTRDVPVSSGASGHRAASTAVVDESRSPGRHSTATIDHEPTGEEDPATADEPARASSVTPVDSTSIDSDIAVSVRGLVKTYGGGGLRKSEVVHALAGVDLDVRRGTVHALLGPNGAGKTTIVRIISTLLQPDSGSVRVLGEDGIADPVKVRRAIGVSGQYAAVDANLTAFENLRMVGRLYGLNRHAADARARELLADFRLLDVADRPTRTFSGGMRRRIDLAGALVARPGLVILDEPTTGLDPRGRRDMWALIEELVSVGTTVLLTTQYLEEADTLADEITVIDRGSVIAQGTAEELKSTITQARLTVRVDGVTDRAAVSRVLQGIGIGPVQAGPEPAEWSVAVDDGTRSSAAAVRELSAQGFDVVDAQVTVPTLDDVFLSLTETERPSE